MGGGDHGAGAAGAGFTTVGGLLLSPTCGLAATGLPGSPAFASAVRGPLTGGGAGAGSTHDSNIVAIRGKYAAVATRRNGELLTRER